MTQHPTDESDTRIAEILRGTNTIALVGWSPRTDRPSHSVAAFLKSCGYRVIPVNPVQAGQQALGETVRASLADIAPEESVDMVDIFRRSEDVPSVVEEALAHLPGLKTVWMQLGIRNEAAATAARAKGVTVVQNRCPAIDIPRLGIWRE